ncbi:MAG: hypothetical protein HY548_01130 [Elusimicrobia bacterium]|nr:hypothetical protein [Elusimicrobiota bacterium]
MNWIYWTVGALWIVDGFFYFMYPTVVKKLLSRTRREGRFVLVSVGPMSASALLCMAAQTALEPWALHAMAAVSFLQAALYFLAAWPPTSKKLSRLFLLPNRYYRLWGLLLTVLGPVLIGLRP